MFGNGNCHFKKLHFKLTFFIFRIARRGHSDVNCAAEVLEQHNSNVSIIYKDMYAYYKASSKGKHTPFLETIIKTMRLW